MIKSRNVLTEEKMYYGNDYYKKYIIYFLEEFMIKYVYTKLSEIKRNTSIRKKVLFILGVMIENNSSVCYKLRELI